MSEMENAADLIDTGFPVGDAIDFLRVIWAVDHALQRRSKSMVKALGVTGPQRLVIRIIGRFPSLYHRQLAAILHVHPSSLTALLKRLERRDLISRRPDARDGRRTLLGLTARGRALNRETPGTVEAAAQRTLKACGRRDLDGARTVLARFAQELGADVPSSTPSTTPLHSRVADMPRSRGSRSHDRHPPA